MATQYTDAHRVFSQVLMKYRVLNSKQVKKVFERICVKYEVPSPNLQNFIITINNKLEGLHLAVRKVIQEGTEDDTSCYVLVNNTNTEVSSSCSSFSKNELEFMKKLVEIVIETEEGFIWEHEGINLARHHSLKLGASAVENLIEKLTEEQWILFDGGKISLGALSLGELQMYIEEHFEGMCDKCFLCKRLTLKGHKCQNCSIRGHRVCMRNYWHDRGVSPVCPNSTCKTPFQEIPSAMFKKPKLTNKSPKK